MGFDFWRKERVSLIPLALSIWLMAACEWATTPAEAWSNGGYSSDIDSPDYGTHDWIADKALTLQTKDVAFLTSENHARFLLGTEAPDNPDYIGDTRNHHVYYRSTGLLQDDVCALRASQTYSEALMYLISGDYSEAAFYIGAMAHYVSDVGVYAHTMGSATDWGTEIHHSDYENWFITNMDDFVFPSDILLLPSDAYNATLGLARNSTFGQGVVQSNVWMDQHYNWSDQTTFVPSALRSLYISVGAVASAIDHLLGEFGTAKTKKSTDSNLVIYTLTILAVVATSGILLIRGTRHRR